MLPVSRNTGHLQEIFNPHRERSNNKAKGFKCQASDALALYPIIAFFIQTVVMPAGVCLKECVAFVALADLIDMLQSSACKIISPAALRASEQCSKEAQGILV